MKVKVLYEGKIQEDNKLFYFMCETEYEYKLLVFNCPKNLKPGEYINIEQIDTKLANSRCGIQSIFGYVKKS